MYLIGWNKRPDWRFAVESKIDLNGVASAYCTSH